MYGCIYVLGFLIVSVCEQYFMWLDSTLNRPKYYSLLKETNDLKNVGLNKPPDSLLPGSKTGSPVQPG